MEETIELLDRRRRRRTETGSHNANERSTGMVCRGIMAYAERAALLNRSEAVWRLGHGSPIPGELIVGSAAPDLLRSGLKVLRSLILDHKRFIFVPSSTSARELLTIGNALKPLEYAIIDTHEENLWRLASRQYRGQHWADLGPALEQFVQDCGPRIAVGMYRVSHLAPCQMFYAHIDHAHEAALIAMADSMFQEHRGLPLLVDLAEGFCNLTFGMETVASSAQLAFAQEGEPFRYRGDRETLR